MLWNLKRMKYESCPAPCLAYQLPFLLFCFQLLEWWKAKLMKFLSIWARNGFGCKQQKTCHQSLLFPSCNTKSDGVYWFDFCLEDQQIHSQTHSSVLAWEIPWIEEPGGLQSMGLLTSWTWLKRCSTHAYLIYGYMKSNMRAYYMTEAM